MERTPDRALVRVGLAPRLESVAAAREALETLPDPAEPGRRDDLALLVTELVVNGVRHSGLGEGDHIGLEVEEYPPCLHVEVSDPGAGFAPRLVEPPPSRPSGRGLLLVDRIARRWGVRRDGRTHVWFDLEWRRGPERAPRRRPPTARDYAKGVVTGPSRSRSRS
jgi:anti-sigma regulatory factor (Ser/Thr protein kinase)